METERQHHHDSPASAPASSRALQRAMSSRPAAITSGGQPVGAGTGPAGHPAASSSCSAASEEWLTAKLAGLNCSWWARVPTSSPTAARGCCCACCACCGADARPAAAGAAGPGSSSCCSRRSRPGRSAASSRRRAAAGCPGEFGSKPARMVGGLRRAVGPLGSAELARRQTLPAWSPSVGPGGKGRHPPGAWTGPGSPPSISARTRPSSRGPAMPTTLRCTAASSGRASLRSPAASSAAATSVLTSTTARARTRSLSPEALAPAPSRHSRMLQLVWQQAAASGQVCPCMLRCAASWLPQAAPPCSCSCPPAIGGPAARVERHAWQGPPQGLPPQASSSRTASKLPAAAARLSAVLPAASGTSRHGPPSSRSAASACSRRRLVLPSWARQRQRACSGVSPPAPARAASRRGMCRARHTSTSMHPVLAAAAWSGVRLELSVAAASAPWLSRRRTSLGAAACAAAAARCSAP